MPRSWLLAYTSPWDYVEQGRGSKDHDDTNDDSSPDLSPDGRKIVYHSNRSGDFEIIVMSATDRFPVFSPDGNMVACNRWDLGVGALWKMRADGSRQTKKRYEAGVLLAPVPSLFTGRSERGAEV
jgi:Tol biopolymer transport system component